MIVVQDVGGVGTFFQRIDGNPIIERLDGEVRAPLQVILHETWTKYERAMFGIYLVEPFEVPVGKVAIGSPIYVKDELDDVVRETFVIVDKPEQEKEPYDPFMIMQLRIEALEARIATLEAKL